MMTSLSTSSGFACSIADGADWREVGRRLLEDLETIRTDDDGMNIGFLYASDALADDMSSLLTLVKNVTRIQHWYGATGYGICGNGLSLAGRPAAVAMIGRLPEDSFKGFSIPPDTNGRLPDGVTPWLQNNTPIAAITHGILCAPAATSLRDITDKGSLFTIGGFACGSAGGVHMTDSAVVPDDLLSGVILREDANIMTCVSQGCIEAGPIHHITKCEDNVVTEINDRPALDVLQESIDSIDLGEDEGKGDRNGHVHIGFPVEGNDKGALLVRNITDADENTKAITIAHPVHRGDAIQFVYRDRQTAMKDLSSKLRALHNRASNECGCAHFKPKALLYFGCGARLPQESNAGTFPKNDDEARLITDIFGDIPMAGFYTAAEISGGHIYGYTGVPVLFL